jgi:Regulator of chromosome condensation (RCC1) repeat
VPVPTLLFQVSQRRPPPAISSHFASRSPLRLNLLLLGTRLRIRNSPKTMSGQHSADSDGTTAEFTAAAGCSLRELPRKRDINCVDSHLLCFTWGRGEDGCVVVICDVVVVARRTAAIWLGVCRSFRVRAQLRSAHSPCIASPPIPFFRQLGLGDTSDQDTPAYVDALRGVGVKQLACGSGHTVVLTTDGEVFSWGTDGLRKLRRSVIECHVFAWISHLPCVGLISSPAAKAGATTGGWGTETTAGSTCPGSSSPSPDRWWCR